MNNETTINVSNLKGTAKSMTFRDTVSLDAGLIVLGLESLKNVITLRFYQNRKSSVVRACVWIHDCKNNRYATGVGRASGYGFDTRSVVASMAFKDTGVTFSSDLDCAYKGLEQVKALALAITKELGYEKTHLIPFHA